MPIKMNYSGNISLQAIHTLQHKTKLIEAFIDNSKGIIIDNSYKNNKEYPSIHS